MAKQPTNLSMRPIPVWRLKTRYGPLIDRPIDAESIGRALIHAGLIEYAAFDGLGHPTHFRETLAFHETPLNKRNDMIRDSILSFFKTPDNTHVEIKISKK